MTNYIKLTKDNIKKLKPTKIAAIAIAGEEAMGDAGAINIVDKDLRLYSTSFKDLEQENLGKVIGRPEDWSYFYTGFGNHLFVSPELEAKLLDYINNCDNPKHLPQKMMIHANWYDGLKEILSEDKK